MLERKSWIVGTVIMLSASVAWSQPGGPGRGPGGFFGPLGPGGPPSYTMLLGMPDVQKELATSEEQNKKIGELQEEQREQMRASFEGLNFQDAPNLTPEEREKRFAEAREKGEAANRKLDEKVRALIDDKQLARLEQLRLQREGEAAFGRPDVVKQLNLSEWQREQIAKIQDASRPQPGGFGPPDFAKIEEQRRKAQADIVALLDEKQVATWKQLKGTDFTFPPPQFGFGPGGPGGMGGQKRQIVREFDKNDDGWLNTEERKAARASLSQRGGPGGRGPGGLGGPRGPGGRGPGGFGSRSEPGKPGPKVAPEDVAANTTAPLYDPEVLRTLFFEFENPDWEAELADFRNTDVDVPATLTVDGLKLSNVGMHFRGMSSFGMVGSGSKRSFNVSLDLADEKQRLYGYKTLNLLNAHEDASFLHSALYSHVARKYIAAPKVNFVKVVVNGESWGIYVNAQQFDKSFLAENYKSTKGTRWKVRGSPGGGGGLDYIGDKIEDYKRRYEIKSEDKPGAWKALIKLCRTLKETPVEQLERALESQLDLDGVLWFLALDNALINSDGYWVRASDYCLYRDEKGKFHVVPHDMNETFHVAMGPGMGGPGGRGPGGPGGPGGPRRPEGSGGPESRRPDGDSPRGERGSAERRPEERGPGGPGGRGPGGPGGGYALDPLIGLNDHSKPLRSRLLAVPNLRAKYLAHVREIAEKQLDWKELGPVVAKYETLLGKEIEADTRKLTSYAAFQQAISATPAEGAIGRPGDSLFTFAKERRKFLLEYKEP